MATITKKKSKVKNSKKNFVKNVNKKGNIPTKIKKELSKELIEKVKKDISKKGSGAMPEGMRIRSELADKKRALSASEYNQEIKNLSDNDTILVFLQTFSINEIKNMLMNPDVAMKKTKDKPINQIFETYDYEKFTFLPDNRDIDKNHEKQLEESMLGKLLESEITVNSEFKIIDGQHRYNICKKNNLPLRYKINDNYTVEDAQIFSNNVKKWSPAEHLKYRCAIGNKDCIALRDFMVKYDFIITPALELLSGSTKKVNKTFKNGGFVIKDMDLAIRVAEDMMRIKNEVPFKKHKNFRYQTAMVHILTKKSDIFNVDKFIKKIEGTEYLLIQTNVGKMIKHIEVLWNSHLPKHKHISLK